MKSKPKSSPEDVIHSRTRARSHSFCVCIRMCVCGGGLEIHKMMIIPKKFSSAGSTSGRARAQLVYTWLLGAESARTACVGRKNWFFHPRERVRAAFWNYWFKTPVVCLKLEMEIAVESPPWVAFLSHSLFYFPLIPRSTLFLFFASALFLSVRNFYNSAHPLFDSCLIYFFQDFRAGGTLFLWGINLGLL